MVQEDIQTQPEPRSKTVTAAVTLSEHADISLVAMARRASVSDVVRDMTISDIVAEAVRIRQTLEAA
jgi:hypothetical protein